MGFGGIGVWQLLIVLVIVLLLFGTKKLRNIGGDLGSAIKSFRSSVKDVKDGAEEAKDEVADTLEDTAVIEGEVTSKEHDRA